MGQCNYANPKKTQLMIVGTGEKNAVLVSRLEVLKIQDKVEN